MKPFEAIQGSGAIILGQPHGGTWLPDTLIARLDENGRKLADTDWHIGRLYDGLLPDVTIVRSNVHRYAIASRPLATCHAQPWKNRGLYRQAQLSGITVYAGFLSGKHECRFLT